MAQRGSLRASDEDREHIAQRLHQATTEGRLAPDELEHRLGSALSARTYAELDAVVSDLPGQRVSRPRPRRVLASMPNHPIVFVAALPFVLAAVAIVTVVVTGLAAIWMLWVAFAWLAFGRRGHWACASRHRHQRLGPHPRRSVGPGQYWA